MSSYPNVVAVQPVVQVVSTPGPPVAVVATAAPAVAAVAVQPAVPVCVAEVQIGVVSIGQVIIGGTGGPCPHMTALMDSSNQPIRESATGLVILVETH